MGNPGEFFAPISAGPYRGIPAIHLVDTDEKALEANIPAIVQRATETIGFTRGKNFLYLSRALDGNLVKLFRELGFYVIADAGVGERGDWVHEANHVMIGSKDATHIGGRIDSYVYVGDPDQDLHEPEFMPDVQQVPKFLYIPYFSKKVLAFIANSQYPWAIQVHQPIAFKMSFDEE